MHFSPLQRACPGARPAWLMMLGPDWLMMDPVTDPRRRGPGMVRRAIGRPLQPDGKATLRAIRWVESLMTMKARTLEPFNLIHNNHKYMHDNKGVDFGAILI